MRSGAHRRLARLDVQLAIDRLRVRQSSTALSASAARTLTHPIALVVPFAAGALGTALLDRRPAVEPTGTSPPARRRAASGTGVFRLARSAVRAWARTRVAREALAPLLRSMLDTRDDPIGRQDISR